MPEINEPKLSYLKDDPNQQIAYTIAILNNSICELQSLLKTHLSNMEDIIAEK